MQLFKITLFAGLMAMLISTVAALSHVEFSYNPNTNEVHGILIHNGVRRIDQKGPMNPWGPTGRWFMKDGYAIKLFPNFDKYSLYWPHGYIREADLGSRHFGSDRWLVKKVLYDTK